MSGLSIRGVHKTYPNGVQVLKGIDIDVEAGQFLILVGSSGCGKSTLLNMIAGLEPITQGEIRIGGRIVNDLPPKSRDIAMVFQSYALYPSMTVRQNISFGLEVRKVPAAEQKRAVDRVAELLQITHLLDRKPKQLSGGQRQRVAMGRAMARDPVLFLFDEPLSNLDAKLRVQMRAELKRLHQRLEITTIYVTHDQVEAMTLGDRIAVMSAGRLQQLGAPQDVYDHPANVFVAGFIGSPPMNLLQGVVRDGHVEAGDLTFAREGLDAGEVVVGIRPEGLRPVGEADAGPGLAVHVDVVEPLGDEVLVHGSVEARDAGVRIEPEEATLLVQTSDRAAMTVRLEPDMRPAEGSTLHLRVDPKTVHLFDASTGAAL
jgi:multiple sugar transport system ATP-binding protein